MRVHSKNLHKVTNLWKNYGAGKSNHDFQSCRGNSARLLNFLAILKLHRSPKGTKTLTKTKLERAFTDHLFLLFLLCQVSNGADLSWDACQIEWYKRHDTSVYDTKIIVFWLVSEVFDKIIRFSRPNMKFWSGRCEWDQLGDLKLRSLFV